MCDNVRYSFINAANRWGCKYYEITKDYVNEQQLFFNKIIGIKNYILSNSNINKVLYLDSDMLIRKDTPNPFNLFTNDDLVYMVKDVYPSYTKKFLDEKYYPSIIYPCLDTAHKRLNLIKNFDQVYLEYAGWFCNCGMYLFTPRNCLKEIYSFIYNMPEYNAASFDEQASWNYILKYSNKLTHVDYTWNYINPDISSGKMNNYIYHFTGFNNHINLKKMVLTYDWKSV